MQSKSAATRSKMMNIAILMAMNLQAEDRDSSSLLNLIYSVLFLPLFIMSLL